MIIGSDVSFGFVTEIRNGLQRFCVSASLPLGSPLRVIGASAGGSMLEAESTSCMAMHGC